MSTKLEDSQKEKLKEEVPKKYKVIFHNDDYTPFEFVIFILIDYFSKDESEAFQIAKNIHNDGKGIAGVFTKDIAETKSVQVNFIAQQNEFPLLSTIEIE
jgi:ATP-dependent Clp protease adaptor protein ClpS